MNIIKSVKNLTKGEKILWLGSLFVIFVSSAIVPDANWASVMTSLVGATALIFVAKGDPIGQLAGILFALLYGIISLHFRYYGETITYLGMSAPSAVWALAVWLKNPYSAHQVKVASMSLKKWLLLFIGTAVVTYIMWHVLAFFNTANLTVSTISVITSFMASMLTMLRSPYYALFYTANDIVLIILWVLASVKDIAYVPMVLCFVIFLINDLYGFINWRRMLKRQAG